MKSKFASAFFAGALTAGTVFGAHATASAESVKFLMNWVFGGQHVAFFAARDRGFFKKNGLDVTLLQGRGSGKAATDVDTKQVEYSYGDLLAATHLISKGGKNRAAGVGEVFQGGAFLSLEKTGIKKPKDLEGKRMGGNPGAFGNVLLPAMAAASGFDHTKVIQKTMKSSLLTPALLEGKVDFFAGARGSSLPRMAILAKQQGLKLNYLSFKDMGIETYGYVIQAHRDRIEKNPGQVQRF
ncbi:MAG: ABC transporter substrate-binding protein, partial [Candidatus Tectomicrobia bacterium]|nr:ABC transporter substrate-binding protein [Candidatus Tectomicrobia bacterium]